MTLAPLPPPRRTARLRAAVPALLLGAAVTALSAFLFLRGLGGDSLVGDEATYGRVTLETAASGRLLPLRLGGGPYLDKPPLGFLALRLSFALLGPSELAARLPSAAAGLATVALLAWIGARRFGITAGALAAVVFSTAKVVLSHHGVRGGTFDAALALLVTGALAAHFESLAPDRERWFRACLVLVAIATLLKTLAGAALVAAAVLAVELAVGPRGLASGDSTRLRVGRACGRAGAVLATGLATLGLWLATLAWLGVPGVLARAVGFDLVERNLNGAYGGGRAPAGFYLDRLASDLGPGLLLLVPLGAALFVPGLRGRLDADTRRTLAATLAAPAAMVLLLSLAAAKQRWYLVAVHPAVALAAAAGATSWLRAFRTPLARLAAALLVAALLAPQFSWALRRTGAPPRRTTLDRLGDALALVPEARVWEAPGFARGGPAPPAYQWDRVASNLFYREILPQRVSGWPASPSPGECAIALVAGREPSPALDAAARHVFPPDEGPFEVIDGCGGRIAARLAAEEAQTSDSKWPSLSRLARR